MKIMVVDDEPLARERLGRMIADMPRHVLAGEAADGESALVCARNTDPDVVLLDIHMPAMDGLAVATRLTGLAVPPAIIFTTAYIEHALPAHAVGADGYLLKPVKRAALQQALERAHRPSRAQLRSLGDDVAVQEQRFVVARSHAGQTRVALEDIVYFRAEDKYTSVYHAHGELIISDSLSALEARFGDLFLRIHRKLLVASRHITALYTDADGSRKVGLRHCDTPLPVSRRRLADVRQVLNDNPG